MEHVNPLRTLREATGDGVTEFAERADLTSNLIIRAEQGVYANPPPKLLDALWKYSPESDLHDYSVLLADYHEFQRLTRHSHYGLLHEPYDFGPLTIPRGEHPFLRWRLDSGITARISVSKYYCVHPALMFKFEVQPWLVASIPNDLLRALKESGYSRETLVGLTKAYRLYKDRRTK